MEFPIKIREAQQSDIDQICLIQESNSNFLEIMNREIIEERIRNHADTFLLASLDDQGIAYVSGTVFTDTLLSKWAVEKEPEQPINRPGIYLLCEDELITYFEMNGFVEQGIVDGERSSEVAFLMCWHNPYYQEEI